MSPAAEKRLAIGFSLFLIASLFWASNFGVSTGDSFTLVDDVMWVSVENDQPVESGNNSFERGRDCYIEPGAKVTVIEMMKTRFLVSTSTEEVQYVTSCPPGVHFQVDKDVLSGMTSNSFISTK